MIQRIRFFSFVGIAVLFAVPVAIDAQPPESTKPEAKAAPTAKPETTQKPAEKKPEVRGDASKREGYTAENNPTTKGGRGTPDLDNPQAPAAWVLVDGKSGTYKEEGGNKLLQWFIEEPVSPTPKFRVEAYEPLMGTPKDFKAIFRTVEPADGLDLVYAIAAKEGTFELGRDYSLLNPGENFTIRNGATGDEIKEIAPLAAGKYAILAAVKNTSTGKETLAVTYFTVKGDGK